MSEHNYCITGCGEKVFKVRTNLCSSCFDEIDECDRCFELAMESNPSFCFNLNRRKLPKKHIIITNGMAKVGSYCSKCSNTYKLKQVYTMVGGK